jgi:hypothetical protein
MVYHKISNYKGFLLYLHVGTMSEMVYWKIGDLGHFITEEHGSIDLSGGYGVIRRSFQFMELSFQRKIDHIVNIVKDNLDVNNK